MDSTASILNIVLVEDNDNLRDLLGAALRSQGHRVLELACAEDVEDVVGGQKVDIFIIDIGLPGESGLSLAQRLRSVDPHVGIIIASAKTALDNRVNSYKLGADIYLNKPLEIAELGAAITGLSKRVDAHRRSGAGSNSSLTLNSTSMQLSGPQGQVNLSTAEIKLLTALIRAPEHRMDLWQICSTLDLEPTGQFKAALEVRIVRLRKKLLSVGADVTCIKSTRQSGYQLCIHITLC